MVDTLRWYTADALLVDLTSHNHRLRAVSEEEAERRMHRLYPRAVVLLARHDSSRRQDFHPSSRRG
jgi:hypothetical protein